MTCCCSLRLLYKVHAMELDLSSQLHQVILFSHYSSTELSKERLFLIEKLQPAFQALAPSRCFRLRASSLTRCGWEREREGESLRSCLINLNFCVQKVDEKC